MKLTLYHGTGQETINPSYLYFAKEKEDAMQFAIGLREDGKFNEEAFIYTTEIDTNDVVIVEDFDEFDSLAYYDRNCPDIAWNPETDWYIVRNPRLTLVEHFNVEL